MRLQSSALQGDDIAPQLTTILDQVRVGVGERCPQDVTIQELRERCAQINEDHHPSLNNGTTPRFAQSIGEASVIAFQRLHKDRRIE